MTAPSLLHTLPRPKRTKSLLQELLLTVAVAVPKAQPFLRWVSENALTLFGLGSICAGAYIHNHVLGFVVIGISLLLFEHKLSAGSSK